MVDLRLIIFQNEMFIYGHKFAHDIELVLREELQFDLRAFIIFNPGGNLVPNFEKLLVFQARAS